MACKSLSASTCRLEPSVFSRIMNAISWHFAPCEIETHLSQLLPELSPEWAKDQWELARLRGAMRSAVFSGGKRLRSQLVLEAYATTCRARGETPQLAQIAPAACALELIHAYSLVHDDLPAMDDADTRRGRPSCHIEWGEALAILVGDGLQTLAFETLCELSAPPLLVVRAMKIVASAAGEQGMVGGQTIDIEWSQEHITQVSGAQLLEMHALKTGALIRASAETGAVLGAGSNEQVTALREYGAQLGRAFQIQDDVLDIEGDPAMMGKKSTDTANFKITAPGAFGLEQARQMAIESSQNAERALQIFGPEADALRSLSKFVVNRKA